MSVAPSPLALMPARKPVKNRIALITSHNLARQREQHAADHAAKIQGMFANATYEKEPRRNEAIKISSNPEPVRSQKPVRDLGVCKERPKDNKRSGGGGSKQFVPWCSRKR